MKKIRNKERRTDERCWGRNAVLTLLEFAPEKCKDIYLSKGIQSSFEQKLLELAGHSGVKVQRVDSMYLDELTQGENHQGVVASFSGIATTSLNEFLTLHDNAGDPMLLLVLDHINDPHNLGAIIRTAEVVGADGIIYPKRRAALPGGTVLKTSAGAALRMPLIEVVNISRTLKVLQKHGLWTIGLDHQAKEDIWAEPLPERLALVVGSEGEGISSLVSKTCDGLRRIPMRGKTGSLNASVAAAVGMFEWTRGLK